MDYNGIAGVKVLTLGTGNMLLPKNENRGEKLTGKGRRESSMMP